MPIENLLNGYENRVKGIINDYYTLHDYFKNLIQNSYVNYFRQHRATFRRKLKNKQPSIFTPAEIDWLGPIVEVFQLRQTQDESYYTKPKTEI